MSEASQNIHDMIQGFPLDQSPTTLTTSRLLDILQAINERLDKIETTAQHANNVAGCLANGIKPD